MNRNFSFVVVLLVVACLGLGFWLYRTSLEEYISTPSVAQPIKKTSLANLNDENYWEDYTNPNRNFSTKVPSGWVLEEVNGELNDLLKVSLFKTDVAPSKEQSLLELTEIYINFIPSEDTYLSDERLAIDSKAILIDNLPFYYQTLDTSIFGDAPSPDDIVWLRVYPNHEHYTHPTFGYFGSFEDIHFFDQILQSSSLTLE